MRARTVAICVLCAVMLNCSNPQDAKQVIYLIDASASIPAETQAGTLRSMVAAAAALNRGDELVVVPITGAALTDTPAQIQRFNLKLTREPYDADRRRFAGEVEAALDQLLRNMIASPFQQTDLLGAFGLAAEEIATTSDVTRKLVCLSDFIQDDRQFDFKRDRIVANVSVATREAARLAGNHAGVFSGVQVYLGTLQSTDLRSLSKSRQEGIRSFWLALLESEGAHVSWKTDGLGHVAEFITGPGLTGTVRKAERLR